jgi:hypothetical protein
MTLMLLSRSLHSHVALISEGRAMRPLTRAGLIALLVIRAIKADDRPAQTVASVTTSKADQASQRREGPIGKQYQQLVAEFEAEQIARRRARTKAQSTPAKPVVSETRPRDLIVHYARRMMESGRGEPRRPRGPRRTALGDRQARPRRHGGV